MHDGVFEALLGPHLLFSTRSRAETVDLLSTVALTDAQLAAYDVSPRDLVLALTSAPR